MSDERWVPMKGFEGLYEVSDLGRIKSLKRQVKAGHNHRIVFTLEEGVLSPHLQTGKSKTGRVYSYRTFQAFDNKPGAVERCHSKTTVVGRLVWEHFVGPIPPGRYVRYKDKDPSNCAVVNLHLQTGREMMLEARR